MRRIAPFTFAAFLWFASCQELKRDGEKTNFTSLDPKDIGIDFRNDLTYDEDFNVYLFKSFYNGAGVGLGDINNDGLLDIFFCGNQVDNKLYLNRGNFMFKDVTALAGLASPNVWSNGVSMADINGDGWLDIYVCKAGKPGGENRHNELFINQGLTAGRDVPVFVESSAQYGLNDLGLSVHAAFFDMDRDGDLDMYLLNNSLYPHDIIIEPLPGLRNKRDPDGGNKLYRNDGNSFTDVSVEAGIYGSAIGFGLGVSIGDVNRDGWQDIYVANDFFERDYLYLNNHDGTFTESLEKLMPEISQGAMGVDIADMNNDGFPEVFVTEMLPKGDARVKTKVVFDSWEMYNYKKDNGYHRQFPRNSFQLNNGFAGNNQDISFSEIARYSGVEATDWSWGVLMADFNNDGNKEIFITNGITKDLTDLDYLNFYSVGDELKMSYRTTGTVIADLIDLMPSVAIPNHLYAQVENMKYEEVSKKWGTYDPGFSNGAAYGDLDNDGDLDLVVNNIDMLPFIYRNNSSGKRDSHFLNISLESKGNNRFAIGSQVTLKAGGKQFFQELLPMRGSMSTVDRRLHFGLGDIDLIDTLEIIWPEGDEHILFNISADQFLELRKWELPGVTRQNLVSNMSSRPFLLEETGSHNLNYVHKESDFVDFESDQLLNYMVSNEGPKIAVGDVNGDGLQDIYVGGAKGYPGALFQLSAGGNVEKTNKELFEQDKSSEDSDAAFADIDGDGDEDLLVTSGSIEFSGNSFALANRIYTNDGSGNYSRSQQTIPSGKLGINSCVAVCDFDQDGDLDIFLGGRAVPSAYGVPADSYLLQNDGTGNFRDVTKELASGLQKIGMVTDACWFDYDRDGDFDLFICGDWMPIRAFKNEKNSLFEVTDEAGFSGTNGFWNTLANIDLDNDGDMDIIAGNLGLNTQLRASKEKPVSMVISDFDRNGEIDHIISVFEGDKAYPIATKGEVTRQLPYLQKKFQKHVDYAEKTVEEIFTAEQMANMLKLEVFETASMVFWNEAGHFTSQQLPFQAQFAPIYGILAIDIDQDGISEILVGGNQYRAKPQTGIYAGSFGAVFKPMEGRVLRYMKPSETGFFVEGEIRDLDQILIHGETFILVAKNDGALKMFKVTQ